MQRDGLMFGEAINNWNDIEHGQPNAEEIQKTSERLLFDETWQAAKLLRP